HLGERDDEIGPAKRLRQVELRELRKSEAIGRRKDIVVVQVHEGDLVVIENLFETRLFENESRVAAMSLPLGDEDFAGVPAAENFDNRADQRGMRIDVWRGDGRLDEIGFQQDRFAADSGSSKTQFLEAPANDIDQVRLIRFGPAYKDLRPAEMFEL